jgi:hypothetical protein
MDDTQDVYFSPAEEEMIESIQEIYGVTEYEAKKAVISNKKQNAWMYQQRGNLDLAEVLLKELGEWNETWEEEFEALREAGKEYKKIILPGDDDDNSFI